MKYVHFFLITVLGAIMLLSACGGDEWILSKGLYSAGVFVVNEGNYGESDGSLSFIDKQGTVNNDIYSLNNEGVPLGDVVQSMFVHESLAFLVVNNSNKVAVVQAEDMQLLYTISELSLPRYIIIDGGYGYISEWVSFGEPGRVSVVDLLSHEIVATIPVGYGAESLAIRDNHLYVSNSFEASISVIDLSTHLVINNLTVGEGPSSMLLDDSGTLWVLCSGGYDEDWSPSNNGQLVALNKLDEPLFTVDLGMNVSGKIAIDLALEVLYFINGTTAYRYDISTTRIDKFIENEQAVAFYGIGVAKDGRIYISDSKGLLSAGEVAIYDSDAMLIETVQVGRGPNSFVFHN